MAKDTIGGVWGSFSEVYIDSPLLIRPSDIYDIDFPDNHHLYMILGIEKLYIQDYFMKENTIDIKLENDNGESFKIFMENVDKNSSIKIPMNRRSIIINSEKHSVTELLLSLGKQIMSTILYIGQSKGKEQKKIAAERLISHSTLQKILALITDDKMELDILLITFGVTEGKIITTLTPENVSKTVLDEYDDYAKDDDLINIVEAKLINFFKPSFNKTFIKGVVPSDAHESYNDYFIKRFNAMDIYFTGLNDFVFKTDECEFNPRLNSISYGITDKRNSFEYIASYVRGLKE